MPNEAFTTRITNTSGAKLSLQCIPPHGVTLGTSAGVDDFTDILGDIDALVIGDGIGISAINALAFYNAVSRGQIRVEKRAFIDATRKITPTTPTTTFKPVLLDGAVRQLQVNFVAQPVTMVDGTANGNIGSFKIADIGTKGVQFFGAYANLAFTTAGTGIVATTTFKFSVGTTQTVTNDTLTGTLGNIVPSTNITLVAGAGTAEAIGGAPAQIVSGSGTALWLNLGVADAGSTANDIATVTGTVVVTLMPLGKF